MSEIRKRSIKAAIWIYVGFLIGAANTYFLTHKAWFSPDQNGLTRVIIETGQLIFAFSTLGTTSFLLKFFPYYKDNLDARKNDMLALALSIATLGFLICTGFIFLIEPIIVRKFSEKSILFVDYFQLIIPMGFFIMLYHILEAYSYGFGKGVITSLLKETVLRFFTAIVILLKIFNFIDFHTFIILFSFQYLVIVLLLAFHLKRNNQLWINFRISRVTRKFRKKIIAIMGFTFIVVVVSMLRQSIDGLVLASKQDLGKVGIFGLAAYMSSVLQVPFRSMIAITIPILSRSWKDKNLVEIERIYKRSSINLLSFSLFAFFLIWLNFNDGIQLLGINAEYLEGKTVFLLLGIVAIIEMGTGVNGQIISTSTMWSFELWTSLLLTCLIIPLSYYLTVKYGLVGPALANLVSFSVYNAVRLYFLWKKYRMQPFSIKTIEVLLIAAFSYLTCLLFKELHGLTGILLKSFLFISLFLAGIYVRNVSADIRPIINNLLLRVGIKGKE